MQHLHEKHGKVRYKDKPVKQLHGKLNEVLQNAITEKIVEEIPAKMLEMFRKDVFVFSGMKTYAELKEASQLLLTPEGKIKPFYQFREDVKKVHTTYNERYLQAEHQFATGSAQMAANWANVDQSNDIQYRTAQDDRVRADHAALANITLPASDKFWNKYYPPNGWNCRCTAVEVRPGKYDRTDSDIADRLGESATTKLDKNGNNAAEIFRFNPGKQSVIFPPKHPYYAQHCKGAKLNVTGLIGFTKIMLSEMEDKCRFQKEVVQESNKLSSQRIKEYKNGGSVNKSILVNTASTDYKDVFACCDFFAKTGELSEILPKIHKNDPLYKTFFKDLIGTRYEGKCPDLKVGNKYYELEGFEPGGKNALRNMLNRGKEQAPNIIIKDEGSTTRYIKKIIKSRVMNGQQINEVWRLKANGVLEQIY